MIALCLAALLLSSPQAGAAAAPSAAELLARNRIAAGVEGRRPVRESWSVRSSGLTGTLDVVRAGADHSATLQLGPFRTERGIVHGQRYHQNDNGETVLERPEPSQEERQVAQSVARVREPVPAWILTRTFASGHVTRIYYDLRTYLAVRTEKSADGHTLRTSYDDFRRDARGGLRAAHFFGSDERPGTDFDYRLTHVAPAPELALSGLTLPGDARTLVAFPAGVTSVRLPARIAGGRVYVTLAIAGRPLEFLLDSGSSNITLDESLVPQLGLASYGRAAETAAGTFETRRVVVPSVAVGPLTMSDVVMRTGPVAKSASPAPLAGLLGFDFFAGVGLSIDYGAGTVDARRPGSWLPPPGSVALPLRLNAQLPVTAATVGEATGDDFILDTGAQAGLVLFQRFVRAHADVAALPAAAGTRYESGIGGAVPFRALAVKRLTLGPLAFAGPESLLALPPDALGFDTRDGLVGSAILDRFSVFFDYSAAKIYFGPPGRPVREARPRSRPAASPPPRGRAEGARSE